MRHFIPLAILALITVLSTACADVSGPTPVLKASVYSPSSVTISSTTTVSYTTPINMTPDQVEFMKQQQQQ
ncbi:MAG: hypothetical protein EON60_05980 [Alphaproteobacteria bacterium]|nr:MAG: hypothetical protein EON60_05980 [Alphaproteobacteria bacterium]